MEDFMEAGAERKEKERKYLKKLNEEILDVVVE